MLKKKYFCISCEKEVFPPLRKDRPGHRGSPPKYCKKCRSDNRRSLNNKSWKGGKIVDRNGYILILDERLSHLKGLSRYIREHRYVMEKKIGRPLQSNEIVHHLNGIRMASH